MHEMHLDIVIITDVPIFTGAPKHSLENTEPKSGTGNARSSKEGHETSAKASESLPFECTTGDQIQWGHEMKMKAPQVHMSLLCCSDEPGTCGVLAPASGATWALRSHPAVIARDSLII